MGEIFVVGILVSLPLVLALSAKMIWFNEAERRPSILIAALIIGGGAWVILWLTLILCSSMVRFSLDLILH